jgi:hypothetical protein
VVQNLPDLEFCSQNRGGSPKHVYLMDMNELYLVAVRLPGWEFMAVASHINARKAVRGLAADLQDFHEQGQRSSAAQLMQQGASAVAVAAIEDARPTGECLELEVAERRLALKRKAEELELEIADRQQDLAERRMKLKREAEEWELELAERRSIEKQKLTIQNQKLELAEHWMRCMQTADPNWRADARLQLQAKDRLCNAHMIEPLLAITGPAQDAAPSLQSASLTLKEVG